jgi:hypothetical protein
MAHFDDPHSTTTAQVHCNECDFRVLTNMFGLPDGNDNVSTEEAADIELQLIEAVMFRIIMRKRIRLVSNPVVTMISVSHLVHLVSPSGGSCLPDGNCPSEIYCR